MGSFKRKYLLLGGIVPFFGLLLWAASAKWRAPDPVVVPKDTAIQVTLNHALASDKNRPGDQFQATVAEPVMIENKTVIPQGAEVEGLVADAKRSGRIKGRARLRLVLETVAVDGKKYEISTDSTTRVGGNHKNRDIALIGGGAGGGVLIGAAAAGGKGALIGGPVGAGAGTAVAFLTGKKDIRLPAETTVTFRLAHPVAIMEEGHSST
jgi:hypothetical protein